MCLGSASVSTEQVCGQVSGQCKCQGSTIVRAVQVSGQCQNQGSAKIRVVQKSGQCKCQGSAIIVRAVQIFGQVSWPANVSAVQV